MVKNIQGYVSDSVIKKKLHVNADDTRQGGSIPGLGRSPEAGYSNPLHYSYLKKISWTGEPGRLQPTTSQTGLSN